MGSANTADRIKLVPNILTIVRIILVPVFLTVLFAHPHQHGWRLISALVFAVAIGTDFFDGKIARKYNIVSDFGKIWDPIADKALTGAGFISLSILGELWWPVTVLILVRELGITWLREVLKSKKIIMPANRGGKLKTLTQSVALLMFLTWLAKMPLWFAWAGYLVMAAAFVLTLYSGVVYLIEAKKLAANNEAV